MARVKQIQNEKPIFINVEVSKKTRDDLNKLKEVFQAGSQKEVIERVVAIASAIADASVAPAQR